MTSELGKVYKVNNDALSVIYVFFLNDNDELCAEEEAKNLCIQVIDKGVKKYCVQGRIQNVKR